MNIVVLDGCTLNPGDLSWEPLEALGNCVIYERTRSEETVARARAAEIILTNKVILDRTVLQQLPALQYVGVTATGYNIVDVAAARERQIVVTNVPAYSTPSVVQMTFALLLELTHHVGDHARSVRAGRWSACPDFSFQECPLIELNGLTLGIVGFGAIGRGVADVAQALGMDVLVQTRHVPAEPAEQVQFVTLDHLLRSSDVVSLHCPLTPETRHLINADRLALVPPSAFLINTSRGPLVDEPALAEALNTGQLAGAAMDVLSTEPPPPDHPLLHARNCVITPHHAWATSAARERLMRVTVDNVRAFLEGKPRNVVGG